MTPRPRLRQPDRAADRLAAAVERARARRAARRRRARSARRAASAASASISTRCRARRRRRRATPCRPADGFLPAAASVGSSPWPRCSISCRLYFASSFSGSRPIACSKLAIAASRSSERSCCCVPCGGVEFQETTLTTPSRLEARERSAGSGSCDDDRLEPLGQLGAADREHRVGDGVVEQLARPQQRAASAGRRRRRGRRATRSPASNGASARGLQPVVGAPAAKRTSSAGIALARARDVDRDEREQDGADDAARRRRRAGARGAGAAAARLTRPPSAAPASGSASRPA